MARFDNLSGKTFGRLTIGEASRNARGNVTWTCLCSCGNGVTVLASNLRSGKTVSCGCKQTEDRVVHGAYKSPEYRSWAKMKTRCTDSSAPQWKDYGGRGITYCDRWDSFVNFIVDMGKMPGVGYTLERKNNDGNYGPDNCIWATRKIQARNRRDNHLITFQGRTLTIVEWSEITGIKFSTLHGRLASGWPIKRAITEAVQYHAKHS